MKGIGTISESALWRVILNVESRLRPEHPAGNFKR